LCGNQNNHNNIYFFLCVMSYHARLWFLVG
jgi:hypothetical protein